MTDRLPCDIEREAGNAERATKQLRDAWGRFVKACSDCGRHPADLPSRRCPDCEGYRWHTGDYL